MDCDEKSSKAAQRQDLNGPTSECACENCQSAERTKSRAQNTGPEGTIELSPALQRWGEWRKDGKFRKDDRVLTPVRGKQTRVAESVSDTKGSNNVSSAAARSLCAVGNRGGCEE